jgi:adenylate kinase
MGLRVVVVGIPGVGKTTVVAKLVAKVKGTKRVNFGTVMFEEARRHGWAKNRDDLRKLTVARQRKLQTFAAGRISKQRERVVVVDTHLFIRTDEGFWPGLPFEVVRALKPTHLVLVEATAEEVAERRSADSGRYRDPVAKEELALEMEIARGFLTASSALTGAPMLLARNRDGRASDAASMIAAALRKASA